MLSFQRHGYSLLTFLGHTVIMRVKDRWAVATAPNMFVEYSTIIWDTYDLVECTMMYA